MVPSSCRFLSFSLSISIVIIRWFSAKYFHNRLPTPVTKIKPHDKFVAAAAKKHLEQLTNFGARPAGSFQNEVQAVSFLVSRLESIDRQANSSRIGMEIDVQTVDGSFYLDKFAGVGLAQQYSGLQNVVARLAPKSDKFVKRPAVLINCHFDSVPQGPGASDDGVSCAVMLEIIRVIINSKRIILNNDLIFLFNGAEEYILPASHGFITKHHWAPDIKAFLNLEAAGSGGRELLFQSGPGNSWLLDAYIRSAPHPFASVIGQEIFQAGIIPSDTDFRIFRDFGQIPGLDIAFVKEGFVYHTEYDTSNRIPLGSIQRAGDNVLAVAVRLARKKDLGGDSSNSSAVFYDLFGLKMISYPSWAGVVLNLAAIALTCWMLHDDARIFSKKLDVEMKICLQAVVLFMLTECLTAVISVTCCSVLGLTLGMLGYSMAWYSSPYLLFFLYCIPTIFIILFMLQQAKLYLGRWTKLQPSELFIERFYLHAMSLVFATACLLLTVTGFNSAFIFSTSLLFPAAWWLSAKYLGSNTWKSFFLYNLLQTVPLTMMSYMIQLVLMIFIPIMGRRGTSGNPDIILGVASAIFTIIFLQFVFPILISIRKQFFLKTVCVISFSLTLILIVIFGKGFPYNSDPVHPTPQRLSAYHTLRTLPTEQGPVTDGGILIGGWDYNWYTRLAEHMPEYSAGQEIEQATCEAMLGCGVPLHGRSIQGNAGAVWLNSSLPRIGRARQTSLEVVSRVQAGGLTNLTLEVTGPSRIVLVLSTLPGAKIVAWSLSNTLATGMEWRVGVPAYYVQLVRGLGQGVHRLSVVVEGEGLVAAVTGHYNHGQEMVGPGFRQFLDRHPPWVSLAAWTVDYEYYLL